MNDKFGFLSTAELLNPHIERDVVETKVHNLVSSYDEIDSDELLKEIMRFRRLVESVNTSDSLSKLVETATMFETPQ